MKPINCSFGETPRSETITQSSAMNDAIRSASLAAIASAHSQAESTIKVCVFSSISDLCEVYMFAADRYWKNATSRVHVLGALRLFQEIFAWGEAGEFAEVVDEVRLVVVTARVGDLHQVADPRNFMVGSGLE